MISIRVLKNSRKGVLKRTLKVQTELSKVSFHPQMSQRNASNPLYGKKKEKHELKSKLLPQKLVIQHTSIRTIDISSDMFYKNYY